MIRVVLPLFVVGVAACAPRVTAAVQAPMVVNVAPVGSSAPVEQSPPRAAPGECRLSLRARQPISVSSPGCYIEDHIQQNVGLLTYDCDGDGPASAVFGSRRYDGAIKGGDIDVQSETEIDWDDGCRWGMTEIIRGPVNGKLVWTYEDRIVSGSGCSGVCHENTTFDVEK